MNDPTMRSVALLVKIVDVAETLSIGRSTVYDLIQDGQLETVHIGRAIRVTTSSVEALVEKRRACAGRTPTPEAATATPAQPSAEPDGYTHYLTLREVTRGQSQ